MAHLVLPSSVYSLLVSPIGLFYLAGISFLAWIGLTVIQRAWLSPLCEIPGPRLAAVSEIWLMWQDIFRNGATTQLLSKLHVEYSRESLRTGGILGR
jgi:hypothetical protein